MLGINNSINNSNYRNNSPKFGMTVKLDSSAVPVIKKQASKMKTIDRTKFLSLIRQGAEHQANNPVDIIIRKTKFRNALAAEVVDSKIGKELGKLKNKIFTQPFRKKDGNLKFLDNASNYANKLHETNKEVIKLVDDIPKATVEDFGKKVKPNTKKS